MNRTCLTTKSLFNSRICFSVKTQVAFRQVHSGVKEPLQLRSVANDKSAKLLSAVRRRNPGAVWRVYKELSNNKDLEKLSAEDHTVALQTFQIKNLKSYDTEEIKFFSKCLSQIMGSMKAHGQTPDIRDYNLMLDFYGRSRNWTSVNKIWPKIQKPNQFSYNLYLQAAVHCKKYEDAFKIFNLMKNSDVKPNEFTYNTIIELNGLMGNINEVDKAFKTYFTPKTEKSGSLISNLIHKNTTVKKQTSYVRAVAPLSRLLPSEIDSTDVLKPSAETFTALINAHGRQKNIVGLNHIYTTMLPLYNVQPNLKIYNSLIEWYCYSEDVESARKLFADMEKAGVKPNVVSFNHIFRHEALKKNRPKVAENLMEYMKTEYSIKPLLTMYTTLIKIHNKHNREDEAKRLYSEYSLLKNKPELLNSSNTQSLSAATA